MAKGELHFSKIQAPILLPPIDFTSSSNTPSKDQRIQRAKDIAKDLSRHVIKTGKISESKTNRRIDSSLGWHLEHLLEQSINQDLNWLTDPASSSDLEDPIFAHQIWKLQNIIFHFDVKETPDIGVAFSQVVTYFLLLVSKELDQICVPTVVGELNLARHLYSQSNVRHLAGGIARCVRLLSDPSIFFYTPKNDGNHWFT